MVLDAYRTKVDEALTKISRPFRETNPNLISALSLALAALTGLLFFLNNIFILISFFTLLLSAMFDAVDGKVARMRGIASKRGDLIDHVFDRYSDIFIILGFSFSVYAQLWIGLLAIIGIMLTSYMGVQSQALGLNRNYSGIMGRADRLVLMLVFILIQYFFRFNVMFAVILVTPIDVLLIIFAITGNVTAIQRFFGSYRALK
jgi:archaetidylinositol phosphate synthase